MANHISTDVLIVGAGPVGLTLAIDLGKRGVRCVVVERNVEASPLPKMELCNSRTMEIFQRLGIADLVREAGWPQETPMDVFVGPSIVDAPYTVLKYASAAEQQRQIARCTDDSMPREAYNRISQYTLEPLLRRIAESTPNVTVLFDHKLESFSQDAKGVRADLIHQALSLQVESQYLVGCDGGNSTVRRQLGIEYEGDFAVVRHLLVFFKEPQLLQKSGAPLARHYYLAGARQAALVAQDDLKRWALHVQIASDADVANIDWRAELRAALGLDLDVELIYVGAWSAHLVVANKYREGRVFLAGDSAHQYIPTGGFGMNTGVGDADNLGWKIAAALAGWAGPGLLDSYEEERLLVGKRNRDKSRFAAEGSRAWRTLFDSEVLTGTAEGLAKRERLVEAVHTGQRRSHEMHGVELGYRYHTSSVIEVEADGADGADDPSYTPTATPGARLPHVWLEAGTQSVHDLVGDCLTLLSLAAEVPAIEAFEVAAHQEGIPLAVQALPAQLRDYYGAAMVLLRPDLHVVWRGNSAPNAEAILRKAVGQPRTSHSPFEKSKETTA